MSGPLFQYPPQASVGQTLPKNKIYEHTKPGGALKELFVRQIDRIVWQYKLAVESINLPLTDAVPEIQIFSITLRGPELQPEVLRSIDLAIPLPILHELNHDGRVKVKAAYKRPSAAKPGAWVQSDYFESAWLPQSTPRSPLPVALDLARLYESLLQPLLPLPPRKGESLSGLVDRLELIKAKENEIARCDTRLQKEKQFNRKVEINAELRRLKTELGALKA